MKTVSVYDAVGTVLCHDLTQIIPGKSKEPVFKKGHIIKKEDISKLLDIGKKNIYVWEINQDILHEDEAAKRIALAASGKGVVFSEPKEGKVELKAAYTGLLKVNLDTLYKVNSLEQIMFATLHSNQEVTQGKTIAGTRIIPLVIDSKEIERVEDICRADSPLIEVKPFKPFKVGLVTTGSEVFSGRIKDGFGPVVKEKFKALGSEVIRQIFVSDDDDLIVKAINTLIQEGAELIAVTGGMSVDPDDVTPAGIRKAGGKVIAYGAPALPGAMFMMAYIGTMPVVGLPGCVMYHKTSIFDLIIPRILAGEEVSRQDMIKLAHGGLCVNCQVCRYPDCGFGKGN